MQNRTKLFVESPMLGGYTLSVRDDWSYKIKHVNITEHEKQEYEKKFGEEIITYNEFFDWWKTLNNLEKTADTNIYTKQQNNPQPETQVDKTSASAQEEEILGFDDEQASDATLNEKGGFDLIL